MNQTFAVNLIWGLALVVGIIVGGVFWLSNRRDRTATAPIDSIDSEKEIQAIPVDRLPVLESDAEQNHLIIIDGAAADDEDAEPPSIGWFY